MSKSCVERECRDCTDLRVLLYIMVVEERSQLISMHVEASLMVIPLRVLGSDLETCTMVLVEEVYVIC